MLKQQLELEIEEALKEVPVLDIHTHLTGRRLTARGLQDILLYHMAISDLYAAGCPNGSRLTEFPNFPAEEEAQQRIREAIPYLSRVRNTSTSWGIRIILEDLYDWKTPVDESNWLKLHEAVKERSNDHSYARSVLDGLRIERSGTELSRRGQGEDDDRLQYALEWGFFTRCQWGEFDTALYELEKCWGREPEAPSPIGGARPQVSRIIRTMDDVEEAIAHYVSKIPYDTVLSTATHLSTDIDYRVVSKEEMAAALANREHAGPHERDIYASFVNEAILTAMEKRSEDGIVFQFSFGAEPLPYETGSRLSQRTIAQVGDMIARHPNLQFQCLLASRHANQSLCTMARELPNLTLAGYWWHNFFPDAMQQTITERLDMLPANKQIGFFSDAYCLEWTYAKLTIVRKILARVLADKVRLGQYRIDDALAIAREILYESPQTILGMKPYAQGGHR
ncbi:hypothetical protein [Paenibacillus montanisoli]|uniref:Glucuronate isomerase n=1 Tax=Paenibacillus montanisoli TaxID=2081970 RepID=A0A328U1A8_9BACL|nr:hypothetical protein [Paenibacillus montanisoli]RAP76578.1 hypothetical protein DL346_14520 [Paenibacillus montanisoli]